MKKLIMSILAAAACLFVVAKEAETIVVLQNDAKTITLPFALKSYAPSNKDVARIEELNETMLRVTALKRGMCVLDVMGDNGLHKTYEISVVPDLVSVYETLTQDLETIPEVHAEIRGNFIRLDGEVNSIAKWSTLSKVIGNYGEVIKSYVDFQPGPETLNRLHETFAQAGFKVQFKRFETEQKKWPYGTVALDLNKKTRVLAVQALCLRAEQRNEILAILKGEPWLSVDVGGDSKKEAGAAPEEKQKQEWLIRTMLMLPVASPAIRLSVAYVALSENDTSNLGAKNTFSVTAPMSYFVNLAKGRTESSSAIIGSAIDPVLSFMANNGVTKVSNKAYTMFESWDGKGANFKSGGTLHVRITSRDVAEIKEISYGFEAKVVGGLVEADKVSLDLDLSFSKIVGLSEGSGGSDNNGDIDRREDKTKQRITCPLGKTLAIGGFGEMVDSASLNGLPGLRKAPLLQWFVSEDGKSLTDRRLLILVSPEIVNDAREGGLNVDGEITIPMDEASKKSVQEMEAERPKAHTGFWSWLNWFEF